VDDTFGQGADQLHRTALEHGGALGDLAHQHRLAQGGASSCTPPESVRIRWARFISQTKCG
jgi:hypothetical protein